jgi:hypothetical protein
VSSITSAIISLSSTNGNQNSILSNLTTSLANQSTAVTTLSSSTSTTIVSLITNIISLENSTKNTTIVQLNHITIGSDSPPIAPTTPYDIYCPVDGWLWNNTFNDGTINTTSKSIDWKVYPKNNNGDSYQMSPYINRIYFKCYLYKYNGTTVSAVPKLLVTIAGNYNGTLTFNYNGVTITNSGYYCFVIDIGDNANKPTFGQVYSENAIDLKSLTFESSSPSGQTVSSVNSTNNTISSISIDTLTSSSYNFVLNSIYLEKNNSVSVYGGATDLANSYKNSGVTEFLFTSAVVKYNYAEHTLSYIYNLFFQKKQSKIISPINYNIPTTST